MATELSRAVVKQQIEHFIAGQLSAQALAAWAFDQVCDEEEELVVYEPEAEDAIRAVLDELMWADEEVFRIDAATAGALRQRLDDDAQQPITAGRDTRLTSSS